MTSPTPPDLTITPRNLAFGRDAPSARWWLGGDLVATAFYDALSATFPRGERFFMDSVRHFRPDVAPALQAQIGAFLTQEAMHTREHLVFNGQLAAHGFDMAAMEARTKAGIDFALRFPPLHQLGATAALEHFTAILAHALLADPRHLAGAGDEAAAMWRWHAMEEVEHKAVAYDTFVAVTGRMLALRRWVLRCATMVIATWLLASTVGGNMADIFRAGRANRPRTWGRVLRFLVVRPGILRQAAGAWLGYFVPGFHPWRRDDRDLLAAVERTLPPAQGAVAAA
ncbi:MAG: metal-dependent hydrolase [Pseudomonadota bacterium]